MTGSKKIAITLFVIALLLISVWLSLDSHTKNSLYRATLCKLIYGKNICNFYAMMDTISHDPEKSDFKKAIQLCREMKNVPKKDSCFKYIAQVVSFYDIEKAKETCEEIKEFNGVHSKEGCYNMVERLREERLAESAVVAFMEARLQRDYEGALIWLTDNAGGQYLSRSDLPLTGLSNPHFADFQILEKEKLETTQFRFKVRIYEEYSGEGIIGYFDEIFNVIRSNGGYMIDSLEERSDFFNQ